MSHFSSKALKALYVLKKHHHRVYGCFSPNLWVKLLEQLSLSPSLLKSTIRELREGSLRAVLRILGAIARLLPRKATLKMTKLGNYFYIF